MSIRDNYRIDNHGDRFFIYDFCNRFICSADTRREAEEEIDQLLMSEELMKVRTHKNHHQALHLFTNIIYCADCGKGMHFKKNRKGYVCGTFNKHGSKACSSHIVREANLSAIVLSEIKNLSLMLKILIYMISLN